MYFEILDIRDFIKKLNFWILKIKKNVKRQEFVTLFGRYFYFQSILMRKLDLMVWFMARVP